MAYRLAGAKPLSEPMLEILLIRPLGTNFSEILVEINTFFIQDNALENVVGKWQPFLSRPQCVNVRV